MKIERINENQIRCTLSNFDLSVRNMNLGELAYGSEKARSLFREMVQRAANEVGFEAEDIPLMVEAIPMANESVMLIITKMEDPEELDTRFSKFSPEEDENDNGWGNLTSEVLEGAGFNPRRFDGIFAEFQLDQGLAKQNRHSWMIIFNSSDILSPQISNCLLTSWSGYCQI